MSETKKLLPCPFCSADGDELGICRADGYWFVRCYVCHVETHRDDSELEAISRWNRRALPDTGAGERSAPKLIGWRTENYLWETQDINEAKNWEPNIGVLPIFEGDVNTKLAAPAQGGRDAV